jgi:hypothetical protein
MTRCGSWWWLIKVSQSEGLSIVKIGLALVLALVQYLDLLSPSGKIEVE